MIDLDFLKQEIERRTGLKDIGEKSQTIELSMARAVYYQIARKDPNHSLSKIGRKVNKDHSCVLHAETKLHGYLKKSEKYRKIFNSLNSDDIFQVQYENERDCKVLKKKVKRYKERIMEMQRELEKSLEVQQELKNLLEKNPIKTELKPKHPLSDMLDKIPYYHVETVRMRLIPIIKMLEKPSMHNYLPKTEMSYE